MENKTSKPVETANSIKPDVSGSFFVRGGAGASEGDWDEDFTHENGNYMNKCIDCKEMFIGHKRRVVCKVCAHKK